MTEQQHKTTHVHFDPINVSTKENEEQQLKTTHVHFDPINVSTKEHDRTTT